MRQGDFGVIRESIHFSCHTARNLSLDLGRLPIAGSHTRDLCDGGLAVSDPLCLAIFLAVF